MMMTMTTTTKIKAMLMVAMMFSCVGMLMMVVYGGNVDGLEEVNVDVKGARSILVIVVVVLLWPMMRGMVMVPVARMVRMVASRL